MGGESFLTQDVGSRDFSKGFGWSLLWFFVVVGNLVSCILAMVGEINLRRVEVFQLRNGSCRESRFHSVWEGCSVKCLLWNRCEACAGG